MKKIHAKKAIMIGKVAGMMYIKVLMKKMTNQRNEEM